MVFQPFLEYIPFGEEDIKKWVRVYKVFWKDDAHSLQPNALIMMDY
jgi:hypothetical protein